MLITKTVTVTITARPDSGNTTPDQPVAPAEPTDAGNTSDTNVAPLPETAPAAADNNNNSANNDSTKTVAPKAEKVI